MAHAAPPTARDLGDCIGQIARSRTARARLLMEREPADADLTAALLDAAAMFDELGVAFAVVGGLAAMVDDDRVRGLVDAEQFAAYQRVKARAG